MFEGKKMALPATNSPRTSARSRITSYNVCYTKLLRYWYSFLFRGRAYFMVLKFLPFVIGLAIAIAQYFPETVNKIV